MLVCLALVIIFRELPGDEVVEVFSVIFSPSDIEVGGDSIFSLHPVGEAGLVFKQGQADELWVFVVMGFYDDLSLGKS